jgi:hypothetical protein
MRGRKPELGSDACALKKAPKAKLVLLCEGTREECLDLDAGGLGWIIMQMEQAEVPHQPRAEELADEV